MTPEFYLTKNRNQLKVYEKDLPQGGKVFMRDGDNFELCLFNPTKDIYAAEIHLNGKKISYKRVVLNPGERVYLERYIDDNAKFEFKTYEVEGNSNDVKRAIEDNGIVEVRFYKEQERNPRDYSFLYTYTIPLNYTGNPYIINKNLTVNDFDFYSTSASLSCEGMSCERVIETGRIGQGSYSDQTFKEIKGDFNSYYSYIVKYKILPESKKDVITSDEIRKYCPECGTRIKKISHKFCYNCGEKL